MKTLIVFCLAVAAVASAPIEEDEKNELIEITKTMETFNALDENEKDEIKNHIFDDKHPRPRPARPARHHDRHHHMDEEKLKEFREKWEAMTAEEREEFVKEKIQKFRENFGESHKEIHRLPRPMPHERPHVQVSEAKFKEFNEKWETMTPEEREEVRHNRRKEAHEKFEALKGDDDESSKHRLFIVRFPQRHHFDHEKMKEMFQKWEAMTPEEREEHIKIMKEKHEEFKNHHPRPMPAEIVGSLPYPKPERPVGRNFQQIRPLPEMNFPMTRPAPRGFMPIMPLPEYDFPMVMPAQSGFQQIMPLGPEPMVFPVENNEESSDELMIVDEEQLLEIFPEGLPFQPIEVVPAETGKQLNIRQGPMARPTPERNPIVRVPLPRQMQPIDPVEEQPLGVPY